MTPVIFQADRRELRAVVALWAVLLVAAVAALLALNANAVRVINHIEYVKSGRYTRAQVLLREAEKRALAALERSAELNRAGEKKVLPRGDADYAAAAALYERAFAMYPGDLYGPDMRPHYERLAALHEAGGEERRAVRASSLAFMAAGDFTNAASYASTLTIRDPSDTESWKVLADIHLRANSQGPAEGAIARYETTGGSAAVVHALRARLAILRHDTAMAIRELEISLEQEAANPQARKQLAELLSDAKRREDAAKVLEEGVALGGSEDGNYMHRLGDLLVLLNRPADAVTALEQAARLEASSAAVQWSLARAYLKLGKKSRHDSALQRAFALDPSLRMKVMDQ